MPAGLITSNTVMAKTRAIRVAMFCANVEVGRPGVEQRNLTKQHTISEAATSIGGAGEERRSQDEAIAGLLPPCPADLRD
jgi:hypothetical protein